jgi:HJR/Mrr/RecB family endonuclease
VTEPAGERIAFEDQRAPRGVDDRKVQKILADVDAYKCRGERPDEWSDSLSR